jgi:hypothetical protein
LRIAVSLYRDDYIAVVVIVFGEKSDDDDEHDKSDGIGEMRPNRRRVGRGVELTQNGF